MTADRRFVLYSVLGAVLVIAGVAIFVPAQNEDDPRPSTYNAGPKGAKAGFLLLSKLGYRVDRNADAIGGLAKVDAAHTTLVIATPFGASKDAETKELEKFVRRGGRILAAGDYGADILPGVYWKNYADSGTDSDCRTIPEGSSDLARVGSLKMETSLLARTDLAETHVAQRCEHGAAVIWYRMGGGTIVWWADDAPLTNLGLHNDANLQLLLASLGPRDRTVLFDEAERPWQPVSPWSKTAGLPIAAMVLQLLLAGVFAVLAFGRRHGPVRTLATTPRTSPLEFAESMGALYHRARAGEAATREARQHFLEMLQREGGLSHDAVQGEAAAIRAALGERFGYDEPRITETLEAAGATDRMPPARALTVVQSLHHIEDELRSRIRKPRRIAAKENTHHA